MGPRLRRCPTTLAVRNAMSQMSSWFVTVERNPHEPSQHSRPHHPKQTSRRWMPCRSCGVQHEASGTGWNGQSKTAGGSATGLCWPAGMVCSSG